jgi:hypothetical protein
VPEEDRVAVLEVGLDRLRVQRALGRVGREHHDEVGFTARLVRLQHA